MSSLGQLIFSEEPSVARIEICVSVEISHIFQRSDNFFGAFQRKYLLKVKNNGQTTKDANSSSKLDWKSKKVPVAKTAFSSAENSFFLTGDIFSNYIILKLSSALLHLITVQCVF